LRGGRGTAMREALDHEEVEGEQRGHSSKKRKEKRPIVERIECD
jgi:hypothetical protein